jgi:RecB family exonuclease
MKKSNFALRLQPSLMEEAKKVAKAEGGAVNQLINVAVAEKVSALRTEEYFAERATRGDLTKALQKCLEEAGHERVERTLESAPVPRARIPRPVWLDQTCTPSLKESQR